MSIKALLSAWLSSNRHRFVDVIIGGRVFGGRYGESPQQPRKGEIRGDTLTIRFATTERLIVIGSSEPLIGQDSELIIPSAVSATFGWHYYGRPQTIENWCEEVYVLRGHSVEFSRIGPLLPIQEKWRYNKTEFVKLL